MDTTTKLDLAEKFRQNWQSQYPFLNQPKIERKVFQPSLLRNSYKMNHSECNADQIDDSLTNLNWLQNLNLFSLPTTQPPLSPPPLPPTFMHPAQMPIKPPHSSPPARMIPPYFEPTSIYADVSKNLEFMIDDASVQFFKANNQLRPPFTDVSLISMAIYSYYKPKVSFPEICYWIEETFPYYKKLPANWKIDIKNNLTLSKCFQKVPKRKEETEKGGFWRFSNEFIQYLQRNTKLSERTNQIIMNQSSPITSPNETNQFIRITSNESEDHFTQFSSNSTPITTSSPIKSPTNNSHNRKRTQPQSEDFNIPKITSIMGSNDCANFKIPKRRSPNEQQQQNLQQPFFTTVPNNNTHIFYDDQLPTMFTECFPDGFDKTKLIDHLSVIQNLTVTANLPPLTPPSPINNLDVNTTYQGMVAGVQQQPQQATPTMFNLGLINGVTSNDMSVINNSFFNTQSTIVNDNGDLAQLPQIIENTKGLNLFNLPPIQLSSAQNSPLDNNNNTNNNSCIERNDNGTANSNIDLNNQLENNRQSPLCPEQITEEEFLSGKAFSHNFLSSQNNDENIQSLLDTSINELTVTGVGIKPPDWWNQSLSASQLSISKLGFSLRSLTNSNNLPSTNLIGSLGDRSSPFSIVGGTIVNGSGTNEEGQWCCENNLEELDIMFGLG